jgi:UDP-glucuronate 4-epimerase
MENFSKIILVTGCAGFIGSHVCEFLLKRGEHVYGIDNLNDYYDINIKYKNLEILNKYKNFTFKKDDICDTNIICEIKPYKVIHLASMAGVRYSIQNPLLYNKVNIGGFINIMEQCVKNKVEHVVYASSSSVYGLNKKIPFSEEDSINSCNSPYACSKLSMENFAKTYYQLYGISNIGLRFFTVYGPRGRPDMAPFLFLNAIINETQFKKYGDGTSSRDYTYIDDIVNGIISALDNENNIKCEIFNLGNSKPISLNKFIEICEKITGKNAIYEQCDEQLGDVPHTYADITKAQRLLNFNPKISLYEGLKLTHDYINNVNPKTNKKSIYFILKNNHTNGSDKLRGYQILKKLNYDVKYIFKYNTNTYDLKNDFIDELTNIKNSIIFWVKTYDIFFLDKIDKTNINVIDIIDDYNYYSTMYDEILNKNIPDEIIVNSKYMKQFLLSNTCYTKNINVIYHHHDDDYSKFIIQNNKLRFGFMGSILSLNHSENFLYIDKLFDNYDIELYDTEIEKYYTDCYKKYKNYDFNNLECMMNDYYINFNCHISIRSDKSNLFYFKTTAKIATAAFFGHNIITTYEESVKDILPEDYPFIIKNTDYENVKKMFDTVIQDYNTDKKLWNYGLTIMKNIKQKLDLNNIINEYYNIIKKYI